MEQIVEMQLVHLQKRLKPRSIHLLWTKELLKYLAEEGYDPGFGARPLKRLIQQEVMNLLSDAILKGTITNNMTIELNYDGKKVTYRIL